MNKMKMIDTITEWIRTEVDSSGVSGVVVGISGGVDAGVCAGLLARAIGSKKVFGVLIKTTGNEEEFQGGLDICSAFNISPMIVDLQENYLDIINVLGKTNSMTEGNFRDRLRSAVLYYIANTNKCLVAGTVNKNEYMLGYFCKNGSGVSDIMPIADLYKSEIWEVGKEIKVPNSIIDKQPTGDYWPGQIDEDIIGVPYDRQDALLMAIEKGIKIEKNIEFDRLMEMHLNSEFKRKGTPRCIVHGNS